MVAIFVSSKAYNIYYCLVDSADPIYQDDIQRIEKALESFCNMSDVHIVSTRLFSRCIIKKKRIEQVPRKEDQYKAACEYENRINQAYEVQCICRTWFEYIQYIHISQNKAHVVELLAYNTSLESEAKKATPRQIPTLNCTKLINVSIYK